jgi:hypothetical protein
MSYDLQIRFKAINPDASSISFHLEQIRRLLQTLAVRDPSLNDTAWLIATGTRESSYFYQVFDADGPTTTALAVFREQFKKDDIVKSLALWNGQEERVKGASIGCLLDRKDGLSDSVQVSVRSMPGISRLGDWHDVSEIIRIACAIFSPICITLETPLYDGVFKDRPGVGWMLYLPRILTVQQVPEAGALVPVMSADNKNQIGTIVVSVTDEPFSEQIRNTSKLPMPSKSAWSIRT